MDKFNILIADGLAEAGQEILSAAGAVDDRTGIAPDELSSIIGGYEAMIVRSRTKVTADLIAAAGQLRVVGRAGVGVDSIDLDAARARGVTVVNSPVATSIAVAELAMALMLDLARRTPYADASMKRAAWEKKALRGTELYGKTLGIIGVGNIGGAVAARASAFGMGIIGYDAFLPDDAIRAHGAEPVSLDSLYARSDYITLHVPLTEETRNMIGAGALEKMKPGVRLICTARGGVVDETALLEALDSGQVAGAGLDVYAQEPPGASSLVGHPAVVATPHIGAQTREAQARAAVDIATEVIAALRGDNLRWRVA